MPGITCPKSFLAKITDHRLFVQATRWKYAINVHLVENSSWSAWGGGGLRKLISTVLVVWLGHRAITKCPHLVDWPARWWGKSQEGSQCLSHSCRGKSSFSQITNNKSHSCPGKYGFFQVCTNKIIIWYANLLILFKLIHRPSSLL